MTIAGIIGCGFAGGALKDWPEKNNKDVKGVVCDQPKGTPLGTLLATLHELDVGSRGFEEHV